MKASKEIEGIVFRNADATLVERLTKQMKARFKNIARYGDSHGRGKNDVRFAYRPRVIGLHDAWGIILVVHSHADGSASVRGPRTGGVEAELVPLTEVVFDVMLSVAEQRYVHFSEKKMPVVRVGTGDKRVLSGGQFESKRRKH